MLHYLERLFPHSSNPAVSKHLYGIWQPFYRVLVVDTMDLVVLVDYDKCQQIRLLSLQSIRMV